jgi:MCM P-loop domain
MDKETVKRILECRGSGEEEGNGKRRRGKEEEQQEQEAPPIVLTRLNDIDDPKYAGVLVQIKARIASNAVSYSIPKVLRAKCTKSRHEGKKHLEMEKAIELKPDQMAQYCESRNREGLHKKFTEETFPRECSPIIEEQAKETLFRLRIRPDVTAISFQKDGQTIDQETGAEYKSYDIYLLGKNHPGVDAIEPGAAYQITGTVIPDPHSQRVTLFVTKLAKDANNDYDLKKIKQLATHLQGMKTLDDRVNWLISETQKRSKIVKRDDVILGAHLTFFSSIRFHFEEKVGERGWILGLTCGDTTTAKSEVYKNEIRLTDGGQLVVAENASVVGLSGAAVQTTNNQWFIEWGPLVIGDRRVLVVDGAQQLSKLEWGKVAEAERDGIMRMEKAAKDVARARTRLMVIANPLGSEISGGGNNAGAKNTCTMDSFMHPYLALPTIMQKHMIARNDFAVFVDRKDVSASEINKPRKEKYDKILDNLKDLRGFVWQERYYVKYDGDSFANAVYSQATALINKFQTNDVELVSIDMKYKLVRMATALALVTCSFDDDFSQVIVKAEHVNYIANWLDSMYSKAGLDKAAEDARAGQIVDREQALELIDNIVQNKKLEGSEIDSDKIIQIVSWISRRTPSFTADQLGNKFNLVEKSERRPFVTALQNEDLIARAAGGFAITAKGVSLVKALGKENEQD